MSIAVKAEGIEWETLMEQAITLREEGEFERGIVVASKALEIAEQADNPSQSSLVISLTSLGMLHYQNGEYTESEPFFRRALTIQESRGEDAIPELVTSLRLLASTYQARGKHDLAEPLYARAIELIGDLPEMRHPDLRMITDNIASLERSNGISEATKRILNEFSDRLEERLQTIGESIRRDTLTQTSEADDSIGELFRESLVGYRLLVPKGWTEIPKDVLEEAVEDGQRADSLIRISFDTGFQPDESEYWMEYPYVLIQTISYADRQGGYPKTREDLPEMIKILTGQDLNQIITDNVSTSTRRVLGDLSLGEVRLDSERERFFWAMDFGPDSDMQGLAVGYFGSQALVQILFYSERKDWDKYREVREQIIDSFRFDEGKEL